jgi:PAS domain S-box-containing protein
MNYIYKKIYLLILFIGISISLFLGYRTYTNNLEKEQIQFNSITKSIIQQIKNRMATYREILYSGVGFFEASDDVTREEWNIFVNKLHIKEFFPGIQGLGYSLVLRENELEKNIKDTRAQGFPSYTIYPEGKRDLYTSIIYIEPFDHRNQRAFGYDMFSEKYRRYAMSRAIETGLPALSNKVRLVQENGKDVKSGFLLYTPLYKKTFPIETKKQRYDAIQGFVYAVFRTKDFINGAVGDSLEMIDIKMYDGTVKNEDNLLFNSNSKINTNNSFNNNVNIEIDGHSWMFEFTAKDTFIDSQQNIYSLIFTLLGFAITFLLSLLIKKQAEFDVLKDDALLNVSQGVMVTNDNRQIIYVNKAFEDLTGYTKEFSYGQKPDFLQGKDTDLDSIKFIQESLKELKPFECEILNYKKDGTSFWNRLSVTPILDDKNNIKRYIGIQNDITNKKMIEKDMLFEKNLIENILSNTSAVIALIDMNGVMVKLNEYGKNFVGYTQEEISAEAYFWKKFIPESIRENATKIIEEARKSNLIEKSQNSWISSNGEEKIFEWSNQIIKDSKGNSEYLITVGIDVTKNVIAQEEHKKYQKQLELSAQISGLTFWELNLKTNIFTFNDLFYTFLSTNAHTEGGYLINQNDYFKRFIPKKSKQNFLNAIAGAYTKKNDYQDSLEHDIKKRDGELLQVLVNYYVAYDEYGIPNKMYGTKYNLTKQKEKEKILIEAKQKAENASKAKTEFLANMSHEIRTPLNGIIGLTNLMLETQLTDIQRNYLTKSIISSEALLHVINDILDYSKIEVNKIELEHIPFELDKMLHQVSNLFIYEAQNKGIELDCTIDPIIHNDLIGDPFRINQILINLVGNALKFTHKGSIDINVNLIEIKNNKMKLSFNVKDTGIGISKDKQNKLFKDFSQVDASNTRKYGGSGLGLVISQKLANLMGGGITVESIEDSGSTFSFTSVVEYKEKDYGFLSQDLKNKQVLVVNNHNEIRKNIEKTLEMFDLKTIVCNDAESALKILEQKDIDYIITEWELPGEDGIKFARNVDSLYHDKVIKTIIISSFNKKDNLISAAQKAGIDIEQLLVKPFSSSSLLDILVNNSDVKLEENKSSEKLLAKGKVLLVEDNEINQLVAKQNLENFGLEVFTALNGAIAVQRAKEEHFDIIFMDLQMPIMDGFEASRKIREFTSDIPIIALSAAVMQEDLKMTREAGMNEHLAKPIDIEKLKKVLIKYLETSIKKVETIQSEIIIEDLIEGVNLEELFQRLNNEKALAYKMLINFSKDKKDIVKELDSLNIESNEFNSLMHNLKGLSGNLSLSDVFILSSKIYTSDNLENKIALLPKLKDSLTIVINSINEKSASKVENTKEISNFSKDEILKEIAELSHDILEGAFITQDRKDLIIKQVTQITNEDTAIQLERYLSNFDYNNAQILLEKIIGELS